MRAASLFIAAMASMIGLVAPFLLARQATGLNQTILLVMMAGVIGAFIYGAGFQPANRALRLAMRPALTWPLTIGALVVLLALR